MSVSSGCTNETWGAKFSQYECSIPIIELKWVPVQECHHYSNKFEVKRRLFSSRHWTKHWGCKNCTIVSRLEENILGYSSTDSLHWRLHCNNLEVLVAKNARCEQGLGLNLLEEINSERPIDHQDLSLPKMIPFLASASF